MELQRVLEENQQKKEETEKGEKGGKKREEEEKDENKTNQIKVENNLELIFASQQERNSALDHLIFLHSNVGDTISITFSKRDACLSNYSHSKSLKLQCLIYGFKTPVFSYLFLV